ncbi:DUF6233 domain-containing protein [Streptomyces sp. Rer75]|uniref:DUF6233 domain-containing protein n=1 Tax=Streptomyces sp. Rer75 TaxID=2750011 RepID=UPI0035A11459
MGVAGVFLVRLQSPAPDLDGGRTRGRQHEPGRPAPERRGHTIVHDAACRHVADNGGKELGTMEALDALMRPGARACHDCDPAAVLVPALERGEGYA